jgi:hypothetical protein
MRRRTEPIQPPPVRLKSPPPGPRKPWEPYLFEPADASAVQAMARGEASPDQQRRALELIVNKLACTYDLSFRPEGDRDTVFAEGKRSVGLQLVKLANISVSELVRREQEIAAQKKP